VGPRAGLDTEARGKILWPCCRGSNPDRPVVQPVVTVIFVIVDLSDWCRECDAVFLYFISFTGNNAFFVYTLSYMTHTFNFVRQIIKLISILYDTKEPD
jgi:hypothetical protein